MLNQYGILSPEQIPQLAQIIAHEFESAPFTNYLFPEQATRQEILPLLFESLLTVYQEIGITYITSDALDGTFSLIPHGQEHHKLSLYGQILKTVPNLAKTLLHLNLIDTTKRIMAVQDQLQELRDYLNEEKNYLFLSSVAVKDQSKETDFMHQMLTNLTDEANSKKQNIIVETETMAMVQLYLHHGFKLAKQVNLNDNKVHLYLLHYCYTS